MHNFPKEPITQGPPKTRRQKLDGLVLDIGVFGAILVGGLLGLFLFGALPALLVH